MFNEPDILHFLDDNAIAYQRLEHPPVYTCQDADRVRPILAGEHIKNIFFRDEGSKHFFLAVARCEKRIDSPGVGKIVAGAQTAFGFAGTIAGLIGRDAGRGEHPGFDQRCGLQGGIGLRC